MSDAPEPPRRPTSAHTAHLQYPTLPPLSASVEEWLSRSRPTNMTSDRSVEPLPKSLSDSWATLSVSDIHSEDGNHSEQTDVGSLIDQTTPDDVASLDGRYSSSEAEAPDDEDPREAEEEEEEEDRDEIQSTAESQPFPTLFSQGGAAIDDSNLTTRTALRQSVDSIEFVEPEKWPEMERVELKHTIRIFEDAAASELLSRLPYTPTDSILMATVQQTMTKKSLGLNNPFRVLYIGQPDFRNIVLDKIGDVLVSSSCAGSQTSSAESSRYHVVPTSFGAGAVPNFAELLPIDVQLVVDECVEATLKSHLHQPNTLDLTFKNRASCRSWWDGDKYHVSSTSEWTLPDMAIVFVSGHDEEAAVRTQRLTHAFLERHGIPAMVISEESLWGSTRDVIPLNHNSLHMCLESRNPQTGETAVLKRYPIDLKTFESIAPSQLNRNLASLIQLYPKKAHKVTIESPKPTEQFLTTDPEKYPRNWIPPIYAERAQGLGPILRLVTLTLISAIALTIGYAAVKTVVLFLAQLVAGSALSHRLSPTATPVLPTTALTLEGLRQTSLSIRPSGQLGLLNDQQSGCSLCSLMEQATGLRTTTSSSSGSPHAFEIQVLGDCHVVIKPPLMCASSKKQPRFNVSVHRYDKTLPHELSQLFDGVYTLRLDREEAYGPVNITVMATAKSKPYIFQTTAVDFGTPWLKISNWRRAARIVSSRLTKELQTAQTGLTEVYGRLSTDLQVAMGDVVKSSHYLRRDAETLRDSLHSRDSVLSRSKQLSEVITRNALQRFQSASSLLHSRSVRVNQEAKELVSSAWSRLGNSAGQLDLASMMDRAQTRARHVVGNRGKKDSTRLGKKGSNC
ncbi:uncharacterized protein N7459_003132 [Penicillium hispanicum]|uniref:uncharacterized protein n=1 Tax=Penicillium hispanicum TaxID=1080232 RepID=UPI002540B45F|nr:uncharacterized protein N7459_003132 [Penicillium hispanicum]KAJ5587367.1 hypothetical protein N7459_003132 [Penicillium hispanicum]